MSEEHGWESQFTEDRRDGDGHVLRAFLVACHEAEVSVEGMSRYLGMEEHAIRAGHRSGRNPMKAVELFVRCLESEGVEYLFGLPDEENTDVMRSKALS